jgi:hypothetical protein
MNTDIIYNIYRKKIELYTCIYIYMYIYRHIHTHTYKERERGDLGLPVLLDSFDIFGHELQDIGLSKRALVLDSLSVV